MRDPGSYRGARRAEAKELWRIDRSRPARWGGWTFFWRERASKDSAAIVRAVDQKRYTDKARRATQ